MKLLTLLILILMCSVYIDAAHAQDKGNTEKAGDIIQVLVPASAYVATFALDDKDGRNQFYKSFFTNLGITYALKYAVNKPRQENKGDYSFPSGHTSASFQGATFIHRRYGLKYSIPAYLGALYVGWSRVEGESDKHDFTDVAAGAVIGMFSSFFFTKPYKGLLVAPSANSERLGVNMSSRW